MECPHILSFVTGLDKIVLCMVDLQRNGNSRAPSNGFGPFGVLPKMKEQFHHIFSWISEFGSSTPKKCDGIILGNCYVQQALDEPVAN